VPQSLVPQSLVPQSLVPQSLVPQSLVPQSFYFEHSRLWVFSPRFYWEIIVLLLIWIRAPHPGPGVVPG
jgi:hypothetical protein